MYYRFGTDSFQLPGEHAEENEYRKIIKKHADGK